MGNSSIKEHYETAKKTGHLVLSDKGLTDFPSQLKTMGPQLRTLDISSNKFSVLPGEIASFKTLKRLTLDRNKLSVLQSEIGEMVKLEFLSACENRIRTLHENLLKLSNLKEVNLTDNLITEFPLVFCHLKQLNILTLNKNAITEVPNGVSKLHVIELNLNQNQISSISNDVAKCPLLKTLRMEENCIQLESFPTSVLSDSQVSVLAIEGNMFDMKNFVHLDGYDKYMNRYTAVKKKMF